MFTLALLLALAAKPPRLDYTLRVDTADLSRIAIELRITHAPANLTLAAHAHPEYDDKYWRFIDDLTAGNCKVTRLDSVRWQLDNAPGQVVVRYTLRIPTDPLPRPAWHPFLSRTGGLVGGPHAFLYVIGGEQATTNVTLDIPKNWKVATSYTNGSAVFNLMESPMLIGEFGDWSFNVNGVPHRVAYYRKANSTVDTVALVHNLEKLAQQAFALFGGAPYQRYTFIFQDDAVGGLEHPAMVTLGSPNLPEIAHEYFHTWNLMHFKPIEYRGIDYKAQPAVSSLWFSEGLTLFYADLLARRAGLRLPDSTRVAHLQSIISRYLATPGNSYYSAETVSRAAYNAPPGALGDYSSASTHNQGEVIGMALDAIIRSETRGARSMDDVMRLVNQRFAARGFTGRDIEDAVVEVCRCKTAHEVFEKYVRNAGTMDFAKYLALLGLQINVTMAPARFANGQLAPDTRIWGSERADGSFRVHISTPNSIWGRAGLHTNDKLVTLNGATIRTWAEFRAVLGRAALGDTLDFVFEHDGQPMKTRVVMAGYDRPMTTIVALPGASALREAWLAGR
jgi:predicted metalloprotease with PDZ domain